MNELPTSHGLRCCKCSCTFSVSKINPGAVFSKQLKDYGSNKDIFENLICLLHTFMLQSVKKKNKADPEVYYQLSCFKSLKKIFSIYLEIKFWYNNPAKISHLSQKKTFEKISVTDFYQPLCLVMPQNLKKIGS